jgi:type I restriction enzyme M protein
MYHPIQFQPQIRKSPFAPYGAGVKSSVLVLEKRLIPLSDGQLSIDQSVVENDDYQVYMARLDAIGYDATGRETGVDETSDLVTDFESKVGW